MTTGNKLMVVVFTVSFLVLGSLQWAEAYTFFIDDFSVTRSGTLIFDDKFNDGNPPPSAPDYLVAHPNVPAASYFVDGTMGPELNTAPNPGKLTLDSSGAVPLTNPLGQSFIHQRAILQTPIAPDSQSGLKLKSTVTFSATGVFDLIIPTLRQEAYDIMFNDGTPTNTPNDIAMMRVIRTQTDLLQVQLAHLDFVGDTVTIVDQTPLETNHNQIALILTKESADSNAITGSFYYIDGGIAGPIQTFANTINIFTDENFTRAEFEAFTPTPVPEPTTMLLLGSGLVGLWRLRNKFRR